MSSSSPFERIAGLDAMVLQFNTPTSSSSALDGIPGVAVPRSTQRRHSKRSSSPLVPRPPLQNKTLDLNIQAHAPLHRSPPSSKLSFSSQQDPSNAGHRSRGTPFQPLPPLPSASSLQLHSFLDISFTPMATNTSSSPRFINTSRQNPLIQELHEPLFPTRSRDDPYWIPTLQHPNSPYVPWSSPVRRQFLRPSTPSSAASSVYRHSLRSYSRGEAQAPDLLAKPQVIEQESIRESKKWKQLPRLMKRNMGRVAKRLIKFTKNSKDNSDEVAVSTPSSARIHFQSQSNENILRSRSLGRAARPFASSPGLRSPSCSSMMSTETNSLAIWLAARQRENLRNAEEPFLLLTLEEYELMGSWIDISHKAKKNGEELECGIPGCDLYPTVTPRVAESMSGEKIVPLVATTEHLPASASTAKPGSSPHGRSFPRLPSSRWFDSIEDVSYNMKASSTRRSLSMPGAWPSV